MGHGHMFGSFDGDPTRGNCVYPLERVCRVLAIATLVTDPDQYLLKDHKTGFVLESLAFDVLLSNRFLTLLAGDIRIGSSYPWLRDLVDTTSGSREDRVCPAWARPYGSLAA